METLLKTEGLTVTYNADDREYVCDLSAIPSGYYVCVNLCTQARFTGEFRLDAAKEKGRPEAGRKVLISGKKTDGIVDFHVIPCDDNKSAEYYDTEELRLHLRVDIPEGNDVSLRCCQSKPIEVNDTVYDREVGVAYLLCFEDWTDNDYNDFVFTVTAWLKKG